MKYAKLPHRWIIHCNLQSLATAGTTAAGSEGSAAALESTIAPALAACEAALGRCLKLTTGTGLPALARAIDRAVQQYVGALQAAVASLRGSLADGGGADSSGGADVAAEGAEAVLPLLTVASQLMQRLALLEASLRQAAAEAAPQLLEGGSGDGAAQSAATNSASAPAAQLPSAAELRLQAQPALRQQLAAFAANAASGAQLLPLARAAASELERQASCAVLRWVADVAAADGGMLGGSCTSLQQQTSVAGGSRRCACKRLILHRALTISPRQVAACVLMLLISWYPLLMDLFYIRTSPPCLTGGRLRAGSADGPAPRPAGAPAPPGRVAGAGGGGGAAAAHLLRLPAAVCDLR